MSSATRIKTAAVLLPIVVVAVVFGGLPGMSVLMAAIAGVGVWEYLNLSGSVADRSRRLGASLWGGVIALSFLCPGHVVPWVLLALGCLGYQTFQSFTRGPDEDSVREWSAMVAGWLFVAAFLGQAVWIRRFGVEPVFFLALIVWVGDSAAYFVGSARGKTKLCPAVSPNKTVEGSVGGALGSVAVAFVCGILLDLPHGAFESAALGLGLNVVAQLGDLGESLLKRSAGVKDSGNIFPGHGGMLDRVDSFLLTVPLYAAHLSFYGG